ncbi:hypothetical protein EC991_010678 [Linnemannia zychae]|nr:hypothetical protein EC991_010678 [Linnemannia zychae]
MMNSRLKWMLKEGTKEHVTFVAFVKKFRFSDKQSATDAYLSLIGSSRIRKQRKKRLKAAFATFQKNHEEDFWAIPAKPVSNTNEVGEGGVVGDEVEDGSGEEGVVEDEVEEGGVIEDDPEEVEFFPSPVVLLDPTEVTDTADTSEDQILIKNRKRKLIDSFNEKEFEAMVEGLDRGHFWRLKSSGRYVEDVLIKSARGTCRVQHHIHSLIIHTEDKFTRELFTESEWLEICCTNLKALPDPSQSILNYLNTFNKGTLEELHTAADAHLPISGPYQHEQHWVFRWIRITVETWLGLYCQDPAPLKSKQLESFYQHDVFGMINSLLRDVKDLAIVHGELTSDDTAERRNKDRTLPTDGTLERKHLGYRCDGLVQVVQGQLPINIGVLEASRVFDNTGNKFLFDTRKVTRELHDMLRNRLRNLDVLTRSAELILVGYVLSGPTMMTLFANCPGGYIVRIRPHHKQFKIAGDISHFKFNLRILKHLLATKLVLLNTKMIMHEVPTNWDDDDDEDATGYIPSTPPRRVHLPPLQSSPTRSGKRQVRGS